MWSNLHLLFWLSLIPVVTEWVGQFYGDHLPAATYGIVALGAAIAFSILVLDHSGQRPGLGGARAIGSDLKGNVSIAHVCGRGRPHVPQPLRRLHPVHPGRRDLVCSQIDVSSGRESHRLKAERPCGAARSSSDTSGCPDHTGSRTIMMVANGKLAKLRICAAGDPG